MSIEDRLSESLTRNLDQLEVSPGDPAAAQRTGDRLRRRTRWTVGVAAAASVAVMITSASVALQSGEKERTDVAPAPIAGAWTRLPDAPLSPRTQGIAVWTGTEAIFLGGETDNLCPPNADCVEPPTYAKDGAAYDPVAQTWRTIAPSPVPVAVHTRYAMLGDELVLVGDDGSWWAYAASDDQWRDLPGQPDAQRYPSLLSARDGKVYVLGRGGGVQALDLHSEEWSTLPRSPHEPRIDAQSVVATPEGIVVTGQDSTAVNDGTVPSWVFAEVYDGTSWRRLERSDMVGGYTWHWTGERLVSPDIQCVDGGEVNPYGSCIPQGGTLDPGTGAWEPLRNAPDLEDVASGWSLVAQEGPLMVIWGYVYDDSAGTWTRIRQPDGAPDHSVAAVVAGGTVIAFGGIDSEQSWGKDALSNRAWAWTP